MEAGAPAAGGSVSSAHVARIDHFEDVVAIANGENARCSGIAVGQRHVLTARHCLPATKIIMGHRVDARFGEARVIDTHVHPGDLDAAIIEVDRDIVTVARRRRVVSRAPAGRVLLVGFGVNNFARMTGFGSKRWAQVPVWGWGCDERRAARAGCDPGSEMIIPRSMGLDTCAGDSGGPVVEWTAHGWRLLAITSRNIGGGASRCGDGGVYVRVDVLGPWIDRTVEEKQ